MKKINVGIASFAHVHAYNYIKILMDMPDVNVTGFCDLNETRARAIKNQYNLESYDSYERLAKQENIDMVLVTTENLYHKDATIAALESGKDVLVEKPIATSLEDADAMINSAKKAGRHLFQCYPCRYHPSAQKLKTMVDGGSGGNGGEIGTILGITSTNHGCMPSHEDPATRWFSDKKLAGGGAVMDHTTHAADLIFWLTGWTPDRVFGIAKKLFHDEIDSDDAGMVLMSFGNDAVASIDPSWNRPQSFPTWGDLTLLVYGSKMTVKIDMFNQNLNIHSNSAVKSLSFHPFSTDIDRAMLNDYLNAFRDDVAPPVSGEDGKKALKVALKAYESNEKKSVVNW
ncbi:MAG: Gfo/Idh/MocA family protein [Promethearchaeota archaeon]